MKPNTADWTASWTQAVTDIRGAAPALRDVTLRLHVQLALDGTRLRFVLSNRFGTESVLIGQAAVVTEGATAQATFGGRPTVEIPPGADLTSDPVEVPAIAGRNFFIDLFLPEETSLSTGNIGGVPMEHLRSGQPCRAPRPRGAAHADSDRPRRSGIRIADASASGR